MKRILSVAIVDMVNRLPNYQDDHRRQLFEEIDGSEDRQLASTQRALHSLYDSERMGVATAEELVRNSEQLDNIERKNDQINKDLKTSQKHLNSIKSIFGGIKTWWNSSKDQKDEIPENQNKLKETLEKSSYKDSGAHPALRNRDPDGRGFYLDDEDELDGRFMAGSKKNTGSSQGQFIQPLTRSKKEQEMEQNLELMSEGLGRLKDLGSALGGEIDRQNTQLDRINTKVDPNLDLLDNQNLQMRKILR
ncbi:hypothetical protein ScPMuIL_005887 [Solemya velum]